MSVIQIVSADMTVESEDDLAPTARRTPGPDGGHVPSGLAGYVHDGEAYCPECAADVMVTLPDGDGEVPVEEYPAYTEDGNPATDPSGFGVGVVSCTDEWDYPGASCGKCLRKLQTNVLVYDSGGVHPDCAELRTDYEKDGRTTAQVFVLPHGDDAEDVQVILAEDFPPLGEAGDVSWVPRTDLIDYQPA